jgi:hypothetical protein
MLRPLEQWICDSCGEVINAPDQGYVEWQETPDLKKFGFRIVHHALYSPRQQNGGSCYYTNQERGGDLPLTDLVGVRGLVELSSWIDLGDWHDHKYSGPLVRDLREWTTLFRRLQLPYYEEARNCIEQIRDEVDRGANDIYLYLPETLKTIVEENEHAA